MDDFVLWLFSVFGPGTFIALLFLHLFWHAEDVVNPEVRKQFADFLLDTRAHPVSRDFTPIFVSLFDATFGLYPWTKTFLFRSVRISIIAFVTMMMVFFVVNDVNFNYILNYSWKILLLGIMLNLTPDYISLIESRLIFHHMRGKNLLKILILLLLDLILTSLIISLGFLVLVWYYRGHFWSAVQVLPKVLLKGFTLDGPEGIVIYTTYITSVWVWLYMISVLLMRAQGLLSPFRKLLNIKMYPFRSLGLVAFVPILLMGAIVRWILG